MRKAKQAGGSPLPWERDTEKKSRWHIPRRWMIAIISVNAILALLAALIRFTTPQVVLTPLAYVRPVDLSTTNICQKIDSHILSITRTPTEPTIAQFDSRIVALDTYMTRVMLRLPKYSQGKHDKKFLATLHALKRVTVDWCTSEHRHTIQEADVLKAKLVAFRPQFVVISKKKFKPTPLWYMHIARISYGFTEGLAAPFLVGMWAYRTTMHALALDGRQKKRNGDTDWRRDSFLFAIARLYGAIVCGFILMAAAQRTGFALLFVFSVLALLFGTLSFAAFCSSYADGIDEWARPKLQEFFRHFSFGMGQQKK